MPAYAKPYLGVADQIALLQSRGMVINDVPKANEYLSRLGYYRLSAYWYPFRKTGLSPQGQQIVLDDFKLGTEFKWATDLYAFDKALRLQLLDVLERIEVFVRTGIALTIGKHDPWCHRDPARLDRSFVSPNHHGRTPHTDWISKLDDKEANSKEEFAVHFRSKYAGSQMPIWVAVELLDFGPLSYLLSGLKKPDAAAVARRCNVPRPDLFTSWVRSLSVTRNTCAHHARLWNKPMIDQPRLPPPGMIPLLDHLAGSPHSNRRIYAACAIARYLLLAVNPRTQWSQRLKSHVATFPQNPHVTLTTMGFPPGWEALPLWA